MLSFLLVPLYTSEVVLSSPAEYGKVSVIFSYFVLFNVILAYGMETAFFRFFNKEEDKEKVIGTSTVSLLISSLGFFVIALLLQDQISNFIDIDVKYINLVIWILLLDGLVIIPFAWLRANEKPTRYAIIKIMNVCVNIGLNLFFLLALKNVASTSGLLETIYRPNFEISYIFIANLVASGFTLVLMASFYINLKYKFDRKLLSFSQTYVTDE